MTVSPCEMELLARQINQAHRTAVQQELSAAGLSEVGHPMLLSILESSDSSEKEQQCMAQRDLAQMLHISPAAVANSLKSLEKGGYIYREPGAQDARCNRVLLTPRGACAVQSCQQAFERVSGRMLEGFTDEEKQQLMAFRRRMLRNLTGQESGAKEE